MVWPTSFPMSIPRDRGVLAAFDDVVRSTVEPGPLPAHACPRAARQSQVDFPPAVSTPYVNSIPSDAEPEFRGTRNSSGTSGPSSGGTPRHGVRRTSAPRRSVATSPPMRVRRRSTRSGSTTSPGQDGVVRATSLLPGTRSPGIYARASWRAAERVPARQLPVRGGVAACRRTPSTPHARLLEYPRVDGPRPSTPSPRPSGRYLARRGLADTSASRVWRSSATGSSTSPRPWPARHGGREHLDNLTMGGQLQPPASRRAGARQRQGDPGVRGHPARRRLERHQGGLGRTWTNCSPGRRRRAAGQDERTVDGEFQKYATESGLHPGHFFGPTRG